MEQRFTYHEKIKRDMLKQKLNEKQRQKKPPEGQTRQKDMKEREENDCHVSSLTRTSFQAERGRDISNHRHGQTNTVFSPKCFVSISK